MRQASLVDLIASAYGVDALVKQKRPVPALVIDHIDEKPTELTRLLGRFNEDECACLR